MNTANNLLNSRIRKEYKYLSFTANTTGTNTSLYDGKFKMNPYQQQATFMNQEFGSQYESFFYNKTRFELSPLNRAEISMAPGINWAGSNRGVELKYWINTDFDDVRKWTSQSIKILSCLFYIF